MSYHGPPRLLWPEEGDPGNFPRAQAASPGLGGAGQIQGELWKAKGLGLAGNLTLQEAAVA